MKRFSLVVLYHSEHCLCWYLNIKISELFHLGGFLVRRIFNLANFLIGVVSLKRFFSMAFYISIYNQMKETPLSNSLFATTLSIKKGSYWGLSIKKLQ